MNRKKDNEFFKVINYFLLLGIVGISALVFSIIFKYKILNFNRINYILFAVIFMIIALFTMLSSSLKELGQKILICFQVLMLLILGGTGYYLNSTVKMFRKVNEAAQISENSMYVVVKKDSQMREISEVKNEVVLAPIERDKTNINKFQEELSKEKGFKLNISKSDSYVKAYDELIAGKTKAMLLSSAQASILELHDSEYRNKVDIIYEVKIKSENKSLTSNKEISIKKRRAIIHLKKIVPLISI